MRLSFDRKVGHFQKALILQAEDSLISDRYCLGIFVLLLSGPCPVFLLMIQTNERLQFLKYKVL